MIGSFKVLYSAYVDSIAEQSTFIGEVTEAKGELRNIDGWAVILRDFECNKIINGQYEEKIPP